MEPIFFANTDEWRAWLEGNHATAEEVEVGFYKKHTGRPTMTWSESVDQALCFGWIDGVRHSIDEDSYRNRFTPRRPRSQWSLVNVKKVHELIEAGLMTPAGLAAFEKRREEGIYSYEQRKNPELAPAYEERLRENAAAWEYFQGRAPSYRRQAMHWVMSAKREETRERRLAQLIEDSAQGRPIGPLTRPAERERGS